MEAADFKARALVEGKRYAKDRMVFLRELAQNSRDAGASAIRVSTQLEAGTFVIRFADDGLGMTFRHAERYLFRLYASSKESEARSAGCFGVGFWSVLLFGPDRIEIDSRTGEGEAWRVVSDGELTDVNREPSALPERGTTVTLRKRVVGRRAYEETVEEAYDALARHCKYLRRSDRRASPLPIRFNDRQIDAAFALDGPCWLTFADGAVEGAVGLGDTPGVSVYARGLLVWQGTLLDELAYGAKRAKPLRHPRGLSPQFLLNGNDLNVTYDRRKVVDDRALARLRLRARRRMRELLTRYLDRLSPRPIWRRAVDGLMAVREDVGSAAKRVAEALVLLAVAGAVGWLGFLYLSPAMHAAGEEGGTRVTVGSRDSASEQVPLGNPGRYTGPSTEAVPLSDRLSLLYTPKQATAFRLAAIEEVDPLKGIQRSPPVRGLPLEGVPCGASCLGVAVRFEADPGPLILPVPTGYHVDGESIRVNGDPRPGFVVAGTGEPALWFDRPASGFIAYRAGPVRSHLSPERLADLTTLPATRMPDAIAREVARARAIEGVQRQVAEIRRFVESAIVYDNTEAVANRYATFFGGGREGATWLDFVLEFRRGDCDVKNAVMTIALRDLGIPARLAIGALGREGKTLPGMHAWTEYYHRGWRSVDATGADAPLSASVAVTPDTPNVALRPEPPSPGLPVSGDPGPVIGGTGGPTGAASRHDFFFEHRGTLKRIAVLSAVTLVFSLIIGVIALALGRKKPRIFAPGGGARQRAVVADILSSAMAHPEIWMKSSGLSARPLLPVLGRRRGISLDNAAALGRESALWMSEGRSTLTRRAVRRGAVVLDAGDEVFRKVISRLPGIMDLDEVARLAPFSPDPATDSPVSVGRLVAEMNRSLLRCGLRGLSFRLTEAPLSEGARDVDLTGLYRGWSKYIVLPRRSSLLTRCAALFDEEPGLAVYSALSALMKESVMLREHRAALLSETARSIFKEKRWAKN